MPQHLLLVTHSLRVKTLEFSYCKHQKLALTKIKQSEEVLEKYRLTPGTEEQAKLSEDKALKSQ